MRKLTFRILSIALLFGILFVTQTTFPNKKNHPTNCDITFSIANAKGHCSGCVIKLKEHGVTMGSCTITGEECKCTITNVPPDLTLVAETCCNYMPGYTEFTSCPSGNLVEIYLDPTVECK